MKQLLLIVAISISLYTNAQRVGIGTTTPNAKLEIVGESTTSSTNALMIKNSNGDTLMRFKNNGNINIGYNGGSSGRTLNIGRSGANFFSNDEHFGGAVLPTDTSLVIWSQSEDSCYVILQPSWGKVGVGTYSPKAKFDIKGDFKLGSSGTVLQQVIKTTVSRDLASIAAGAVRLQTFTVAGADLEGTAYISPAAALPDGLIICYVRVSAANTVEVKFLNVSAASINLSLMDFFITVVN